LLKRDLLFVIENLVSLMEEPRLKMLPRQHGIRQKRDDGGIGKSFAAYIRRAVARQESSSSSRTFPSRLDRFRRIEDIPDLISRIANRSG
jgi:hypothetical protein